MNKKLLIVIVAFVAITIVAVAGLFVLLTPDKPRPEPLLTPTPSETPSGAPLPAVEHQGAEEAHEEESKANPILKALPHETSFWRLDFDGSEGDKYRLLALVNYVSGKESPDQKIAEQRPFIEEYVRSTNQPEGTYIIHYEPRRIFERD